MKIISFAVNNFRSINGGLEKNTIKFEGSNTIFIFGQNNVGKSTFLDAYDYFYSDTKLKSLDDFYCRNKEAEIIMELAVEFSESEIKELTKMNTQISKYLFHDKIMIVRKVFSLDAKNNNLTKRVDGQGDAGDGFDDKGFGGAGAHPFFQNKLPKPIKIVAMPNPEDINKLINDILAIGVKNLSDNEQEKLTEAENTIRDLQKKVYGDETIEEYKENANNHYKKLFGQIEIKFRESDKGSDIQSFINKKFTVEFEHKENQGASQEDYKIPKNYKNFGHGSIRMAMFVLLLVEDIAKSNKKIDKGYIVLFEEPELFLHPRLTKQLRNLIYQVSGEDTQFQVLCASHSPQMIDISKEHTSLVRMVQETENSTKLHQIQQEDIIEKEEKNITEQRKEAKQKLQEILRFNPFICESFYADEVVLVEGDTEAIIWRAYLEEFQPKKDIFVVNCGSVSNIPFYQRIFSKFDIKYSVICDTDDKDWNSDFDSPEFNSKTSNQGKIETLFEEHRSKGKASKFFVFNESFEPAHEDKSIPKNLRYAEDTNTDGKPLAANKYWEKIIKYKEEDSFSKIPIIKYIKAILEE